MARRIVVRGRVQGVWFRASTREEAQRLGLNGEVRNRPDGTVEVWAEGEPAAVEQLIAWCGHGPPLAEVVGVAVVEVEPGHVQGFRVAH